MGIRLPRGDDNALLVRRQHHPEQVNYNGNYPYAGGEKGRYREKTVPVGSLPANPWGLYEMHGNVWEWCADWYGDYPTAPQVDPTGPQTGASRVLRGGSWDLSGRYARCAYRSRLKPGLRGQSFGFRFAPGHQGPAEPAIQEMLISFSASPCTSINSLARSAEWPRQ
jgi:formylglycine-generating enzyme required for sulfatase activity